MPRQWCGTSYGRIISAVLIALAVSGASAAGPALPGVRHVSTGQEFAAALSDFRIKNVLINGAWHLHTTAWLGQALTLISARRRCLCFA